MNYYFVTDSEGRIKGHSGPRGNPPFLAPGLTAVQTAGPLTGWPEPPAVGLEWSCGPDGIPFWGDPRSLEDAQSHAIARLKVAHEAALGAGFTWAGKDYDSSPEACQRLREAILETPPQSEPVRLADGTWQTLPGGSVAGLYSAYRAHARSCLQTLATREASVNAATTPSEADEVVW